jgi:hypothetical protein
LAAFFLGAAFLGAARLAVDLRPAAFLLDRFAVLRPADFLFAIARLAYFFVFLAFFAFFDFRAFAIVSSCFLSRFTT